MSEIVILEGTDAAKVYDAVFHAMYLLEAHDIETAHGNLELTPGSSPLGAALARALLILAEAGADVPDDEVPGCDETEDHDDCKHPVIHNCVNAEYRAGD